MNETMILDDLYSFSPCIIKILYDCDEEDDKIKKSVIRLFLISEVTS